MPLPSPSTRAFIALLPDLRRSARRLSRSNNDADDLVQETLLKVWARLAMANQGASDAAPVTDLRAYAFATLRNAAKRPPRPTAELEEAQLPKVSADAAPATVAVSDAMAALNRLPRDQVQLLRLRALDGLSYAEIAKETGLPMGTVTSRLSRGRAALRLALGLPRGAPVSDLFRDE